MHVFTILLAYHNQACILDLIGNLLFLLQNSLTVFYIAFKANNFEHKPYVRFYVIDIFIGTILSCCGGEDEKFCEQIRA